MPTRETGLIFQVIDSHRNDWESMSSGTEQYEDENPYVEPVAAPGLQFDACYNPTDGKIYRATIGSDHNVWIQTITNPSSDWSLVIPAKFTTTNDVTAVTIWPKAGVAGYHLLFARAGTWALNGFELYDENKARVYAYDIGVYAPVPYSQIVRIRKVRGTTTYPDPDYYSWVILTLRVRVDLGGGNYAYSTQMWIADLTDLYSTHIIWPMRDDNNQNWLTQDLVAAWDPWTSKILKFHLANIFGSSPRHYSQGNVLTYQNTDAGHFYDAMAWEASDPRIISDVGGDVSVVRIWHPFVHVLDGSQGYFMFYVLESTNPNATPASADESDGESIYRPLYMRKSVDGVYWSEPIPTGISGDVVVIEPADGYLYVCGNQQAWRILDTTVIDYSNYVLRGNIDINRDNQGSRAMLTVANPEGVNGALRDSVGMEVILSPLSRLENAGWSTLATNRWWISRVDRDPSSVANRLTVELSDIFQPLANPLRETINFLGKQTWDDWKALAPNALYNYQFIDDSDPGGVAPPGTSEVTELTCRGRVIYAGWKGYNGSVQVTFNHYGGIYGTAPTLYCRWADSENWIAVSLVGTDVYLQVMVAGSLIYNDVVWTWGLDASNPANYPLSIDADLHWSLLTLRDGLGNSTSIDLFYYLDASGYSESVNAKGYFGFGMGDSYLKGEFANFHFEEEYAALTSSDLVKTALAWVDLYDPLTLVDYENASEVMATAWGPGLDIENVADGLRTILESDKLSLIYRDGTLTVSQYSSTTPTKTYQNEILEAAETTEGAVGANVIVVDGNENTYTLYDATDLRARGQLVRIYNDLPELMTLADVTARANQDLVRAKMSTAPGGKMVLPPDIQVMDVVTWIDRYGTSQVVRVDGLHIDFDQGERPHQWCTPDLALLVGDKFTRLPTSEVIRW